MKETTIKTTALFLCLLLQGCQMIDFIKYGDVGHKSTYTEELPCPPPYAESTDWTCLYEDSVESVPWGQGENK